MSTPRRITAAEILTDRRALFESDMNWPHDYTRCGVWIYCDCPKCRDYYDPTGEECAKYLNMDPTSFFTDQSDLASFSLTKIAKESLWAAAGPGFYVDADAHVRTLDELIEQLSPPIALQPTHILHIGSNGVIDRFFLLKEKTTWHRRTWKSGRSFWDEEKKNLLVPFQTSNIALCSMLKELFA
jgi:hypothetical protein